MRDPRVRMSGDRVRPLRVRAPRRDELQAPRLLPVVPRPTDGRHGDPSRSTVYIDGEAGALSFMALPAPSAEEVLDVAERTAKRVAALLDKRGRSLDGGDDDGEVWLAQDQPVLASC